MGNSAINLHKIRLGVAALRTLVTVANVRASGLFEARRHQDFFNNILDLLDGGRATFDFLISTLYDFGCESFGALTLKFLGIETGFSDGVSDLFGIEFDDFSVALDDALKHSTSLNLR